MNPQRHISFPKAHPKGLRKIVYIMSPSYSGSTLLTCLLGQHREIATIGELKGSALGDIEKYMCSCGQKLQECEFWETLRSSEELQQFGLDFADWVTHFRSQSLLHDRILRAPVRGRLFEAVRTSVIHTLPSLRRQFDWKIKSNLAVMRAVSRLQGANVFLDASKDPNRLVYLLKHSEIPVKVISLLRDGRGVCGSIMKHTGVSMHSAVSEWRAKIREMSATLRYFEERDVIHLKYEALCESPYETMENICRSIGIGTFSESHRSDYLAHLLGNAMRLARLEEVRLDESWRLRLTQQDLRIFVDLAGRLNSSLGYSEKVGVP